MGYDVYGLNPKINTDVPSIITDFQKKEWSNTTKEEQKEYFAMQDVWHEENPGEYFRANVWYWRPIWNFVCAACDDFLSDADMDAGCSNSGDRISKTKAKRIASRLRNLDKQGIIQSWEDEMMIPYKKAKEHNKKVEEEMEEFRKEMIEKHGKDIVPADYPKEDYAKWNEIYSKRDWSSSYPPSREHIVRFSRFCEESGGFEIC